MKRLMLGKIFGRERSKANTGPAPRRRLTSSVQTSAVDGAHKAEKTYASRRHQFQRNQTLTGSRSGEISSAGEQRAQMLSPRAETHHLRRHRRRLSLHLGGLLLLAGATLLLLYQLVATPRVEYYGQFTTASDMSSVERFEALVDKYLSERPLQRLRVFLDQDELSRYMQASGASEIREVTSVRPSGLGSAIIEIKLREPIATWRIGGSTQFVDKDGSIFGENYYQKPTVSVVDESGIRTEDVRAVTSSRFLQFIGLGVGYARSIGLDVSRVIIPAGTTRQVQLEIKKGDKTTRVKLSIDRPVGEQIEDSLRAYRYLASRDQVPRYIDVRVSGKAFYR